ncbi:MAG: DUF4920 domain-containing protein [Myxococcota bacterium]
MRTLALTVFLAACGATTPAPSPTPDATAATPPAAAHGHDHNAGHGEAEHDETATAASVDSEGWTVYGAAFSSAESASLSTVLATASEHTDQVVHVEGKVSEVCQKAGCWMVVSEGEQHMRIRMKDHGFSVDKAGAGSQCQVQGTLVSRPINPEEVAHFASETRAGGVVPEAGQQGVVYEIVADSVRMRPAG